MDCKHIIQVKGIEGSQLEKFDHVTVTHHLDWLKRNHIDRYRWKWTDPFPLSKGYNYLTFRFENEEDKLHFALRWA